MATTELLILQPTAVPLYEHEDYVLIKCNRTEYLGNGDVVRLQCNTYRTLHVLCVQDSKNAIKFQRSETYWLLYEHNMSDMDRFPARV